MKLSEYFSLEELTHTSQRMDNTPPRKLFGVLAETATRMEEVREVLGGTVISVSSGYRSPAVNRAVGGSPTSAHMSGRAVDFNCYGFGSPLEVCRAIVRAGIRFDQLIEEGTWVHISFDPRMRGEVLTKAKGGGYTSGLRAG